MCQGLGYCHLYCCNLPESSEIFYGTLFFFFMAGTAMLRFFTSHSTIFSHNTHCCTDCNNATTTTEKPVSAPSKIVDIFGFLLSTCLTLLIFGTFSGFFLCAEIMAWVLQLLALSTMFLFVYSMPFLMSQALNFICK